MSLLFTAGGCVDIIRRRTTGRKATAVHRFMVAAPLLLALALVALLMCALLA